MTGPTLRDNWKETFRFQKLNFFKMSQFLEQNDNQKNFNWTFIIWTQWTMLTLYVNSKL